VLEFGLLQHPVYHWLGGSPDGITTNGKVVEIKCPISREIVAGEVPHHYFPPVQIVLEICDLEEAVFIQYKPKCITWPLPEEFSVVTIERNRDWFALVLPQLESFYQEMKTMCQGKQETPSPPVVSPKSMNPKKPMKSTASLMVKNLYNDESFHHWNI
jgi:YqaJ-like viral recombinase domain